MSMIVASASAIGLSLIMAAVAFISLRWDIRLDEQNAGAIAAPAVARTALPGANPGFYVTTSLAITFPLNILIGITISFHLAQGLIALLR